MSEIDRQLVAAAKEGDQLALQTLLLRGSIHLRRHYASRIPSNLLAMDDLLQETFVKAVRYIGDLRSDEPAAFIAWLKRIAETELTEAIRLQQRKKSGGEVNHLSLAAPEGEAESPRVHASIFSVVRLTQPDKGTI